MRILVVSDLHYRLPHFDWLVEAATRPTPWCRRRPRRRGQPGPPRRPDRRPRATTSTMLAERTTVFVASGNHDLDGPGATASRWRRGCGASSRRGLHVDGSSRRRRRHPASPCARGGTGRSPATRSASSWPGLPSTGRPAGCGSTTRPRRALPLCLDGRRTFPDHELAEWIAQHRPDFVFCGHIHQSPWARAAHGTPAWVAPGSSTPASRSAPSRPTSPSTPTPARPTGSGSTDRDSLALA